MTARPEDQPLPLDQGNAERKGRPPGNAADDGKRGGTSLGGKAGDSQFGVSDGAGDNAQRGGGSGSESERSAPGISTDKKSDDTK